MFPYMTTRMSMNMDGFQSLKKIKNHRGPTHGPLAASPSIYVIPATTGISPCASLPSAVRTNLLDSGIVLSSLRLAPGAGFVPPSLVPDPVKAPRTAPDPFGPRDPSRPRPRLRDTRCRGDILKLLAVRAAFRFRCDPLFKKKKYKTKRGGKIAFNSLKAPKHPSGEGEGASRPCQASLLAVAAHLCQD